MRRQLSLYAVAGGLVVLAPQVVAAGQTDAVKALLAEADRASLALRFEEAERSLSDALLLAERTGDATGLARAQRLKCTVFIRMGRANDALTWCNYALVSSETSGDRQGIASALVGLTAASTHLGQRANAREFGERGLGIAEEIGDDALLAHLLLNLERVEAAGPNEDTLLRRAYDLGVKLKNDAIRGEALVGLANNQLGRGELNAARKTYEEAIAVLETYPDIEAIAAAYLSLGRVFRAHGDYEGALQRYQKAIDLLTPTKQRTTIVEAVNASATALTGLGRYQEALAATERGLALARESGNQRVIDFMEGNLAGSLMAVEAYDRAIPLLQTAIAKKPDRYIAAFRYNALAIALTKVGRPVEAMPLADEAVRLTRELKQVDMLDRRLDTRAWILTKLGRFEEALADSHEVMTIIESVRARIVPSDFLKRGFGELSAAAYLRGVDLLSRLGRSGEAIALAEQGRARAFLDLLAARESDDTALATRGADPAGARVGADLASTAMGRPLDLAGMGRIATRLGSTVLVYCVLEDATLIWVLRPGEPLAHTRVPISRDRLSALVAATTAPLRNGSGTGATRGADDLLAMPMRGLGLVALRRDDRKAWRELYDTLVVPIRAQLPARDSRITIVPHGPLFDLAFAALLDPSGRYLIEDYELHYAPGVSVLEFTGRRREAVAANANGPWAIVGNPAILPTVGDRALRPLPGAAREIGSIAALAPKGRVLRLEGARADEATLERTIETSHPAVLHFATHGFVFADGTPPFLALHRRGRAAPDDGRLTLGEVYRLVLDTDLVVLSACRSGSGTVSSDGVLGLTRGFFLAGSPSVLATFWDVSDEATATLMSRFYRSYAKSGAKGSSLRGSQLALLRDLRAGRVMADAAGRRVTLPEHPLLWAGFFLSGEP
jgi:CHAT domain-containing protein/tetratricopeptide (TPR) repeat protein